MADSPLEEMEAHERAHQAGEGRGDPLINQVTLTIAILAVASLFALRCKALGTTGAAWTAAA